MNKILPKDLTSYDFLKTFAVVFMIVDHIGMYFYPEIAWWRVFGRMSAPVWLFLIGYARTRDIPAKLWGGAVILTIANAFIGDVFFPLTILWGMIFARLYIDRIARFMFSGFEPALMTVVLCLLLLIPSHMAVQYGAFCLMIPLYGYMRRNGGEYAPRAGLYVLGFVALTCAAYIVMSAAYNGLSVLQVVALAGGVVATFAGLYFFKPKTFPDLTACLPKPLTALIQFCGRRTLEIYVGHLIIFKILAFALGVDGFGLFEWSWL